MFVKRGSDECFIVCYCSLSDCGVTEAGCDALSSALRINAHLKYLFLFGNNLGGSGLKLVSAGLENPNCKLDILR